MSGGIYCLKPTILVELKYEAFGHSVSIYVTAPSTFSAMAKSSVFALNETHLHSNAL